MIDPAFFADARRRIDAVTTCEDLADAALSLQAVAEVQAEINKRLAELQPMLALLTPPGANLTKLATWVSDFIGAVLTPYLRPIEVYTVQLAQLASEAAALAAAIEAKRNSLGNCSINLPSVEVAD